MIHQNVASGQIPNAGVGTKGLSDPLQDLAFRTHPISVESAMDMENVKS